MAVALFYVTIGSYWAYAERMGIGFGISMEEVHWLLSAGVLLSAAACLSARAVAHRIGQSRPLLLALAMLATTLLIHGMLPTPTMFVITLAVLQLCWNFIDIFQLGTLAVLDPSGRAAALVPAAQGAALAAGPAAAGFVLRSGQRLYRRIAPRGFHERVGRSHLCRCAPSLPKRIGVGSHRFLATLRTRHVIARTRGLTIADRGSAESVDRRYIDEVLSIADGHLWIEGCDTVGIASQYGTPLYVVSETQLRANCRQLAALFGRHWTSRPRRTAAVAQGQLHDGASADPER